MHKLDWLPKRILTHTCPSICTKLNVLSIVVKSHRLLRLGPFSRRGEVVAL
ncbi:hypothetical protein HanIR_Chr16g0835781 [Helianthus annuus]|nr:hypothetical protein HanIR_Chr16g0835781 [Helianthus annuus]